MIAPRKEVDFNGKSYTIRKMPLIRYDEFATQLDKVVKGFRIKPKPAIVSGLLALAGKVLPGWAKPAPVVLAGEFGEFGPIFELIVYNLRTAPRPVARLISIASEIPEAEIMNASIEDVANLAVEIWELNNLARVFGETLKKVMASVQEATTLMNQSK